MTALAEELSNPRCSSAVIQIPARFDFGLAHDFNSASEKTLALHRQLSRQFSRPLRAVANYGGPLFRLGDKLRDNDHRVLISYRRDEGGQWAEVMYADYRREK